MVGSLLHPFPPCLPLSPAKGFSHPPPNVDQTPSTQTTAQYPGPSAGRPWGGRGRCSPAFAGQKTDTRPVLRRFLPVPAASLPLLRGRWRGQRPALGAERRHPTSPVAIKQDGLALARKRKGGIHYASANGPRPPGCSREQGESARGAAPRQAAALPSTLLFSARRLCVSGWWQVGQRRPPRDQLQAVKWAQWPGESRG